MSGSLRRDVQWLGPGFWGDKHKSVEVNRLTNPDEEFEMILNYFEVDAVEGRTWLELNTAFLYRTPPRVRISEGCSRERAVDAKLEEERPMEHPSKS